MSGLDMNETVREAEELLEEQSKLVLELVKNVERALRDASCETLTVREATIVAQCGAYFVKAMTAMSLEIAARFERVEERCRG